MTVWQSSDSTHKITTHEIGIFIDLLAYLNSLSLKHLRRHSFFSSISFKDIKLEPREGLRHPKVFRASVCQLFISQVTRLNRRSIVIWPG